MGANVSASKPRARRGRRRGKHRGMVAEINITPMVDVMLVLLIIFMVAAPLMTVGVPVELPKTAATALPSVEEEPLTVSITADGAITLMKTEIAMDELVSKLRAIAVERTDDKVFLRADGKVPYEVVAQVMGALNNGGFSNIGLVTDTGGPTMDAQ
ncbi:MAG: protein TolR [Maritimibacter sp.]|nr:protein TolR [Maritimibacter sp.]